MIDRIVTQPVIAVDTEADSLHSYFDKVCLIQISADGEDFVIDPLAKIDIARFGQVLSNPDIRKIFHGGDYDLRILNRDFGFTITNMVDTMICAQLLGYEAFGLAALLDRHFGVKLNKAHQRADWSMRPLPPAMLNTPRSTHAISCGCTKCCARSSKRAGGGSGRSKNLGGWRTCATASRTMTSLSGD